MWGDVFRGDWFTEFTRISGYSRAEADKIWDVFNGHIAGEFTCDRIYELAPLNHAPDDVEKQTCLTREEIVNYLKGTGYGWHISDLRIYDTPKELIEFYTWEKCKSCSKSGYESTACIYDENCMIPAAITKAPQSWCYVEEWEENDG